MAAALALLALAPSTARARVEVGETIENEELATLTGGREPLLGRTAKVNVILFWRPEQEHSLDTLKQMAECEEVFRGKPIRMVAVVSGSYPREAIKAAVQDAALRVPVLIDAGDALYGKLQVRQHPLVLVTDGKGKIALGQAYVRLRYCEIVNAHVRHLLGEIDAAQLQAALNPARASFPSDDKNNVARRWVNMGKREAEAGHCDRAIISFGKALAISPENREALTGIEACDPGTRKASIKR